MNVVDALASSNQLSRHGELSLGQNTLVIESGDVIRDLQALNNIVVNVILVKAGMPFDPNLRPGMFARMLIQDVTKKMILIPVDYLKSYGQLDMVLIVKNGVVNRRFVRLGKTELNQVEVVLGLKPDDVLAIQTNE
jgi:multidrug efflux pump subunit AcrA (membrane-fusion protein)